MTQKEKKEIYLKCDLEQMRQLKHFVIVFKELACEYNKAIKGKVESLINKKGEALERLCFVIDSSVWRNGHYPITRPNIGYDTPWEALELLENLSETKLKKNPYLVEGNNECRLNDWLEIMEE